MKNTLIKISLLALFAGFMASPAFAIDQVKLTNGQVVEGTVLNDVMNRYVDIRLVNGDTKRFEHSEVASVDRDVPSRRDADLLGNQSRGFVSVLAGGAYQLESSQNHNVLFDYGVKVGVLSGDMGGTKMAFALSYDRFSQSVDTTLLGHVTSAINDINVQLLFMRIANSGFYFGPNLGIAINTVSFGNLPSANDTATKFEAGAGFGYEFFMTDGFSIGPDVRFEHVFTDAAFNTLKFAIAANFHF
jgi:hypothetical protein